MPRPSSAAAGVLKTKGATPLRAPKVRFAGARRIAEVWNVRLRVTEREFLAELAHVDLLLAALDWQQLDSHTVRRLVIAMRDVYSIGNEVAYALAYPGRRK